MRKVKVMLASIAVSAVIGGAFAFKAKTNNYGSTVYTTLADHVPANDCTIPLDGYSFTVVHQAGQTPVYCTISGATGVCITPTSYYTIPKS